MGIDELKARKK